MKLKKEHLNLQTGDIVLYRSNSLLSRLIRFFTMSEFSHAELIVKNWGYDELTGSVSIGVRGTDFYRYSKGKHISIVRHFDNRDGIDSNEERRIAQRANFMKGVKYDFLSLLWFQPIFQIINRWNGRTKEKAENRMYCSEYVAWVYELESWWNYIPADLYYEGDFYCVYEGILG